MDVAATGARTEMWVLGPAQGKLWLLLGFLNTGPNDTEQDKDNASVKEKTKRFFLLRLRVHGNLLSCWVSLTQQPCKSRPWLQQCSHSKTDTVNCMMLTDILEDPCATSVRKGPDKATIDSRKS